MAPAPSTIAAVLAVFASRHEPALTLTVRHGPSTGLAAGGIDQVIDSFRAPPERRTVTLEVASPPSRIATVCSGAVTAAGDHR